MAFTSVQRAFFAYVAQNGSAVILARIMDSQGNYITRANLSGINLDVTNLTSVVKTTETLTVANVIYDTLQQSPAWTVDLIGFNFRHEIAGTTHFPTADIQYAVNYEFTPTAGAVFIMQGKVVAEKTYT